jgi:predicted transcriptional regulator
MRTTIELSDDLYRQAAAIASDTSRTLSETIAYLIRKGLGEAPATGISVSVRTGLPVVRVGRLITTEDVRSAMD